MKIRIKTQDKALSQTILSLHGQDGISVSQSARFQNAIEPAIIEATEMVSNFLIQHSGDVAKGILGSYLYDKLKASKSTQVIVEETEIDLSTCEESDDFLKLVEKLSKL